MAAEPPNALGPLGHRWRRRRGQRETNGLSGRRTRLSFINIPRLLGKKGLLSLKQKGWSGKHSKIIKSCNMSRHLSLDGLNYWKNSGTCILYFFLKPIHWTEAPPMRTPTKNVRAESNSPSNIWRQQTNLPGNQQRHGVHASEIGGAESTTSPTMVLVKKPLIWWHSKFGEQYPGRITEVSPPCFAVSQLTQPLEVWFGAKTYNWNNIALELFFILVSLHTVASRKPNRR